MGDKMRAGIGYDAHPLVGGRKLILGGVEIPFARGLSGWSDGDVLTHAIIDALLGAAALGDIGTHFPSGDPKYKDISSLVLLGEVKKKLQKTGWRVGNIDATVVAESPKLRDFIEPMRQKLSKVLGVAASQISIKASTGNELGFAGRGEGISAYAIVLIESK
jgi:2-C-methyl-D-erythritol 2,4-cyclodiphosphate synthase